MIASIPVGAQLLVFLFFLTTLLVAWIFSCILINGYKREDKEEKDRRENNE